MGSENVSGTIETHASILHFEGDRVYKRKKPVDLGFLDHRSLDARARSCRREIELNRRLAPDVYLGLAAVNDAAGTLADVMVVMRRLPAERKLSALLDGAEADDAIRSVVRAVASFHARAPRTGLVPGAGSAAALLREWDDNVATMTRSAGTVVPRAELALVAARARRYLRGRGPLFDARIEAGKVRDVHGDLQADDIFCLADGPRIIDCIEFNDRFRHIDVLNDIAFLVMDLERLGHPELAAFALDEYRIASGDVFPRSLIEHYVAYRAHVRAKVACLRFEQGDETAAVDARALHRSARRHLDRARVRLVIVGGAPGTGKTTLARAIGAARGMVYLGTDDIRRASPGGPDRYAPATVEAVYAEMLARARHLLAMGEGVVLDATWRRAASRDAARRVALGTASEMVEIRCALPIADAALRVALRPRGSSEATPAVARSIAERMDPWPTSHAVDTSGAPEDAVAFALDAIDALDPDVLDLAGGRHDGHDDDRRGNAHRDPLAEARGQ